VRQRRPETARLPPRLSLPRERRALLVEAARGLRPADLVVAGGEVLSVYTGELRRADVGIAEGRIAWIGQGAGLERVDVTGAVVVPGLIEPHGHPDIHYTPSALVRTLAEQGTTTVGLELHGLLIDLDDDDVLAVVRGMEAATAKVLWRLRPQRDDGLDRGEERAVRRAIDLLPATGARSIGELTTWPQLLDGDDTVAALVDAAVGLGLQVDAHAPGSSPRTLGQLAAAGLTSEHEAIRGEEVVERLRLGFHVMLRSSSVRADAVDLALHLVRERVPLERVMLTTDGRVAQELVADGSLDAVIRDLVTAGIDPVAAVRMATLAPAAYFGLDAHIGGIAPGRCADLVVVPALEDFRPELVFADGKRVEPGQAAGGDVPWRRWPHPGLRRATLVPERLRAVCHAGPALGLEGLITRQTDRAEGDALVALVDREGRWLTGCTLGGLGATAIASTHTGRHDVLLVGSDENLLVEAYGRVVDAGGGVATPGHLVPLPILGMMYDGSTEELAAAMDALTAGLELPPGAPIEYLTLFLTLAAIPYVRVTPQGILDVRSREVLAPPVPLD
jgi:adenine deaminase